MQMCMASTPTSSVLSLAFRTTSPGLTVPLQPYSGTGVASLGTFAAHLGHGSKSDFGMALPEASDAMHIRQICHSEACKDSY